MPKKGSRKPIRPVVIPIGPSTAYVPLTCGFHALIESDDIEWAEQWNWFALKAGKPGSRYIAAARVEVVDGHRQIFLMHSSLLGLTGRAVTADHIRAGDMLDNRRSNLRPANKRQQAMNKRLYRNNTSGYKGVSWNKLMKKWGAYIRINGRHTLLGWFEIKEEAYGAYCEAARKYHGDFASVT